MLGDEAWSLAEAVLSDGPDIAERTDDVSRAHWETLRAAMGVAIGRAADAADDADLAELVALTDDPDPTSPLALALALAAGRELAGVLGRVRRLVAEAAATEDVAVAARATGEMAADLIDLSGEDLHAEIEAYVAAGQTPAALRALARSTGDDELRGWAHEALDELDRRELAPGVERLRAVVSAGGVPQDPADDVLWVAVVTAVAEEAIDLALAAEAAGASEPGPPAA